MFDNVHQVSDLRTINFVEEFDTYSFEIFTSTCHSKFFFFHYRKIKFSIKDFFIFFVVFIVFCKESRIWVAKKLISAKQ